MSIKLLIADDHQIVGCGIREILQNNSDITVVGVVTSGNDVLRKIGELSPDVVLMDVSMPCPDGIETTRLVTSKYPGIKVIGLSMYGHKQFITSMLDAGASGYLLKECSIDELIKAIVSVYGGGVYLNSEIIQVVIKDYLAISKQQATNNTQMLTERECMVLKSIAEGLNIKSIAHSLGLSNKTIETYRRQIMGKLKVDNIADLVKYAISEGFTTIRKK